MRCYGNFLRDVNKYYIRPIILNVLDYFTEINVEDKKTKIPLKSRDRDVLRKKKMYWEKRMVHWEVRITTTLGQHLNAIRLSVLGRRKYC